jgi:diguanylate cyclase (GGDEF)-like protein
LIASALSQLDASSILVVGSVLLACGSGGLLVVRWSNPRLRGLGWLGGAFAAGGTGALLITLYGRVPTFFAVVFSDWLVLLSFVLLHVAIGAMRQKSSLFPKLGAALLTVQMAGYLAMTYGHSMSRGRVALEGVLVALQLMETMGLLLRGTTAGRRLPAGFTAVVLGGLTGLNLFRSVALLVLPAFRVGAGRHDLETLAFLIFIAAAMGIAFGFFWMTTAELTHELEQMASTDPLTRVYNRRVFREWCEREIDRSRRTGHPFSLLMMDLDHFKKINDRYGHRGGDEMLVAVVETMQDSVRGIDILARWGGEEFVALLPATTLDLAMIVAQRVRTNIEKLLLRTPGATAEEAEGVMRMTVSLGVASYRGAEDSLEEIFARADAALYQAKAAGRNQVLPMV